MFMLTDINTTSAPAIAAAAQAAFRKMFPRASTGIIDRLFFDVRRMFTGHYLDYQAADLRYHNFEHTLQATLCFVQLLVGRHGTRAAPRFTPRQAELGLAAVLLHDTGYLKLRSDKAGTGAKYTHVHVLKSCAFAAAYLPTVGATPHELDGVLGAIRCTGPNSHDQTAAFQHPGRTTHRLRPRHRRLSRADGRARLSGQTGSAVQ